MRVYRASQDGSRIRGWTVQQCVRESLRVNLTWKGSGFSNGVSIWPFRLVEGNIPSVL
jgi:hypothetical protein